MCLDLHTGSPSFVSGSGTTTIMNTTMDDTARYIGGAALVMAVVVGLLFAVVVPLLCCCVYKYRRELYILRSKLNRMEYGLETGRSGSRVIDRDHYSSNPTSPAAVATTPTNSDTQQLLTTPPVKPKPAKPSPTAGYSNVNIVGVLPADLRTPENLEGDDMPPEDQTQKLVDEYLKERKEYEERLLQQNLSKSNNDTPLPAVNRSPAKNIPTHVPGYEDIPDPPSPKHGIVPGNKDVSGVPGYEDIPGPRYEDIPGHVSQSAPVSRSKFMTTQYENPSDAIPESDVLKNLKLGGHPPTHSGGRGEQKMRVAPSKEEYTEVFDNLPTGEAERIGARKTGRALSDSSPNRKVEGQNGEVVGGGVRVASSSGDETSPTLGDRKESDRQSKRKSVKEVVEFNPDSKKLFRVTSTKRPKGANKGGEMSRDFPDGTNGVNSELSLEEKAKVKSGEIEMIAQPLKYAFVNVADKMQYRTESDTLKKEGSGTPQHYTPPMITAGGDLVTPM